MYLFPFFDVSLSLLRCVSFPSSMWLSLFRCVSCHPMCVSSSFCVFLSLLPCLSRSCSAPVPSFCWSIIYRSLNCDPKWPLSESPSPLRHLRKTTHENRTRLNLHNCVMPYVWLTCPSMIPNLVVLCCLSWNLSKRGATNLWPRALESKMYFRYNPASLHLRLTGTAKWALPS